MATNERIAQVQSILTSLDAESGIGIFPEMKRQISEGHRFLVISYGGTGGDALYNLKMRLKKTIDPKDLTSRVRLLAVDTDSSARTEKKAVMTKSGIKTAVEEERFTTSEFFWLENAPAVAAMSAMPETIESWVNPRLVEMINADKSYMDGEGASGVRQIGRLLLSPRETVNNLNTKIVSLVKELTNNNTDNLHVIIISGISGGTGSGIVVDASYLIRSFVDGMGAGVPGRTKYAGFILLPPTGKESDLTNIQKGNKNGYAALKEIDHFMHIAHRGETYDVTLGGRQFISNKNIFDTCYLIDGSHTQLAVANPRQKANAVVADTVIDLMTAKPIVSAGGATFATIDSFMSDAPTTAKAMVERTSETIACRNANYVYCTVGHGQILIPLELMKAYVANKVFDRVYAVYLKFQNVSDEDVNELYKVVSRENTENSVKQVLSRHVDVVFSSLSERKGGPFYAINLLKALADKAEDDYNHLSGKTIVLDRETKLAKIRYIKNEAVRLNNELFEVYTTAMDCMKQYLKQQSDILCVSGKTDSYYGSSYTFMPVDFAKADAKSKIVIKYLDDLVDSDRVKDCAVGLVKEMLDKREEWTDLLVGNKSGAELSKFAAAERIRAFWAEKIGGIVDSTVENYLIKLYSGNPKAVYTEIDTPNGKVPSPESQKALKDAAAAILQQMLNTGDASVPLAELHTEIISLDQIGSHNVLLVPGNAPNLKDAIENELKAMGGAVNLKVAESYANDRISSYSLYVGLPAYMFAWAQRAEKDYEAFIRSNNIGMHMSETKGGELWRDFPNLIVENIWPRFDIGKYTNPRELALGNQSRELFRKALSMGLADRKSIGAAATVGYYAIHTLDYQYRPDPAVFKAYDVELEGTNAKKEAKEKLEKEVRVCAEKLFVKEDWASVNQVAYDGLYTTMRTYVGFDTKELQFPDTVMTPLVMAGKSVPGGWEEKMAADLLRCCIGFSSDLRGTVAVLDELYGMIHDAQKIKEQMQLFAHLLAADLFYYDEDMYQWAYEAGRTCVACDIDPTNDIEQAAKEYYLFRSFREKYDDISDDLIPALLEKTFDDDKAIVIAKRKELQTAAGNLGAKLKVLITQDKRAADQKAIVGSLAFKKEAAYYEINADEIYSFYEELIDVLSRVPNGGYLKQLK